MALSRGSPFYEDFHGLPQVREAWAKVLTAELSEEMVVREAQQRAELLSHENLEEKVHLEEAKREKQRMSSEYQALAKQEWVGKVFFFFF